MVLLQFWALLTLTTSPSQLKVRSILQTYSNGVRAWPAWSLRVSMDFHLLPWSLTVSTILPTAWPRVFIASGVFLGTLVRSYWTPLTMLIFRPAPRWLFAAQISTRDCIEFIRIFHLVLFARILLKFLFLDLKLVRLGIYYFRCRGSVPLQFLLRIFPIFPLLIWPIWSIVTILNLRIFSPKS